MSTLPADYPPPFSPSDYIVTPEAAEDERIDVGVLIVGAGPAGLATAVRLGQLLGEDPELPEQLGEVPIAVAEKGKAPGLPPAVRAPSCAPLPIKTLFPDTPDDGHPALRRGHGRGRLLHAARRRRCASRRRPQMKNHGNWVVSISQLARWMSEQAEELGAFMLPETDCQKLHASTRAA